MEELLDRLAAEVAELKRKDQEREQELTILRGKVTQLENANAVT